MQRGEDGVWTYTSPALEADIFRYTFSVDGVGIMDPNNSLMRPSALRGSSAVHIPGQGLPWKDNGGAHGEVHHHFYKSKLVGDNRDYYVYTPPGYAKGATSYPVLYLLHGYSHEARGWSAVGRANIILDNLIVVQKAKRMIVVMRLGYGALLRCWRPDRWICRNTA